MKPQFIGAAALIAPALIVAACSSSSNNAAPPVGTQPSAVVSAGSPPAQSKAASGGGGTSALAWCHELKAAGPGIIAVGGTSTVSPDAYKTKLESLVSDAPSDIRSDLQVVADIDEKLADGDTNADHALANPAVAQKFRHVVTWLSTNCRSVLPDLPTGLPG